MSELLRLQKENEELTALVTELRIKLDNEAEQVTHYKAEAHRLGDLAKAEEEKVSELRAELDEDDALRARLAELLTATATALKGPPAEGVWHDWSDLPTVASELRRKTTYLQGAIEGLVKDPYPEDDGN